MKAKENKLLKAAEDYDGARAVVASRLAFALGADVNECGPYGTALHLAAERDNTDLVAFLLENGAHVDARSGGEKTPLLKAVPGCVGAVRLLLNAGADPNARDKFGNTALILAALAPAPPEACISLLLERGADPTIALPDGRTPGFFAEVNGNYRAAELLNIATKSREDARGLARVLDEATSTKPAPDNLTNRFADLGRMKPPGDYEKREFPSGRRFDGMESMALAGAAERRAQEEPLAQKQSQRRRL